MKGWRDNMDETRYRKFASEMRNEAYCPYSNYKVGAVLIAVNEEDMPFFFVGCNVENASYGLTICAERNAVFQAVANGYKKIIKLYCATEDGKGCSCGACRQVMAEFSDESSEIEFCDKDGNLISSYKILDLLPHPFLPERLGK